MSTPDGLAAFGEALAARLPGTWNSTDSLNPAYQDRFLTLDTPWDAGHAGYVATNFPLAREVFLRRADGAHFLIFDRLRHPRQFLICALEPDLHHDAFYGVAEPNGIAISCDPPRAASQIARRLLPLYDEALLQVRRQAVRPVPRRAAPALAVGMVSMAWHPDGSVGAVTGVPEATAVLYAVGFQYSPYHQQYLLPASYGDRQQIARIQVASQRLARLGVGITMRPAHPLPKPSVLPVRPPAPVTSSVAR
ncbi:hypothetical protein [Streptomyces sp. H27-S2]|uniref:hypothetical protein n=1 Tax=Streptomyces antarcticus TaxID=2996458 RepID=UPI00226FC109|nr:hypothetical protein [Streptomyces sp. H27-S2]MCY0954963.1 hypothetical protein [Streptomyces sp. H27-S2]